MNDTVPPRYVAKGREVWDTAWSSPITETWCHPLTREQVCTVYPSELAARAAAESLNTYGPKAGSIVTAIASSEQARIDRTADRLIAQAFAPEPLPAWVEGINLEGS